MRWSAGRPHTTPPLPTAQSIKYPTPSPALRPSPPTPAYARAAAGVPALGGGRPAVRRAARGDRRGARRREAVARAGGVAAHRGCDARAAVGADARRAAARGGPVVAVVPGARRGRPHAAAGALPGVGVWGWVGMWGGGRTEVAKLHQGHFQDWECGVVEVWMHSWGSHRCGGEGARGCSCVGEEEQRVVAWPVSGRTRVRKHPRAQTAHAPARALARAHAHATCPSIPWW
eukprot:356048-Chlamydomonas_euryale.AAC.2